MNQSSSLVITLQRHRVLIARVIWVALIAYAFGYLRISVQPFDSPLGLAGIAVIVLGLGVRSLSAGMLRKNEVLATDGIYSIVRNPLYFGSLLLLLGVNLIVADLLVLAVTMGLFAFTYVPTILQEERGLANAYGEQWRAFKQSTPRLFPNLLRLGALRDAHWSAQQWRRNHEHNTVLAAGGILLLIYLYGRFAAL